MTIEQLRRLAREWVDAAACGPSSERDDLVTSLTSTLVAVQTAARKSAVKDGKNDSAD